MEDLLAGAVEVRATDIHIEPGESEFRVRMRVDGLLADSEQLPPGRGRQLCSLIKVRAGMDIALRLKPQDGSMVFVQQQRQHNVRVSSQPTIGGEKLVLRIFPPEEINGKGLSALGMCATTAREFSRMLNRRQGLVLVTGPTGCGKTTTLYAALNLVGRDKLNVMTLEDPVECRLPGITQTQVNPQGGLGFASALRGVLRQDPDVILVGEIRDSETAAITVRAALSGHLVLATLHTVDAASAVARLLDMGCAPYQVAAAVQGVMAQRLVRCPCRCGMGCRRCLGSGYYGRTGVFELLRVDAGRRQAILAGGEIAPPPVTLLDDCRRQLELGKTDERQLAMLELSLEDCL